MFGRLRRILVLTSLLSLPGCYAPLNSPGVSAHTLPDSFRFPAKARSFELNYASLAAEPMQPYRLDAGDVVRVEIGNLYSRVRRLPDVNGAPSPIDGPVSYAVEAELADQGEIMLPLVGTVQLQDKSPAEAKQAITAAYRDGYLDNPIVTVTLVTERTNRIMVLGAVASQNVYELSPEECDVAHAISLAGGLIPNQADEIQIHRKMLLDDLSGGVTRIPLRSLEPPQLSSQEVRLNEGDVVVVKRNPDEVFFVTGRLSPNNLVRFTLGAENRDLGNGFILPKDRDVDVITAVAMAGYIDPIDSPTTVTVHRFGSNCEPLLIRVDLIAARYNKNENLMIQGGDIIYLNPDSAWWFRRTFDRIIPELLTAPYIEGLRRWINPNRVN